MVVLAPESEVLPGQVSSTLFVGGLKPRGSLVRNRHLHLHAAGPATVAAPQKPPCPLHSSASASKLFPKATCQWCVLPELRAEQCCMGSVFELRSCRLLWLVTGHAASLAHSLYALEGMWCSVLTVWMKGELVSELNPVRKSV